MKCRAINGDYGPGLDGKVSAGTKRGGLGRLFYWIIRRF
jgi:hypothetical protein